MNGFSTVSWISLLVRSPIDRITRLVTGQRAVAEHDRPLTRDELLEILDRCARKQRLLKRVLRIDNKRQHAGFKYKRNIGVRQFRVEQEPRAALEYGRLGQQMLRYMEELAQIKAQQKLEAQKRDAAKGARVPVLLIFTAKKTGRIAVRYGDSHLCDLPGQRAAASAEGRVFEYFQPDQVDGFLRCAAEQGVLDAARECVESMQIERERT
ncbi:MAG: hypothetical protein EKK53_27675 [Burkholderiales bacterium]|nr:MAG: hypothetical protein EKK53_27675 [Burkholderiales bacterium]